MVEEIGLKKDLAVRDRDYVGRNVGGDVAGEGLNDGQRGERALTVEAGRTLEETGVQIEHVAGISLATGGALQNERNLAVGDGVLGEVIEYDEGVHAVFHEPLADCGAGEGSEVLVGGVIGGGSGDDASELKRAGGFKGCYGADNVGVLLADGDVDGINRAELRVTAGEADAIDLRLIDNGIHGDGRLASAAVADDELTLAATDRDHGVDGLDAGKERLADRFTDHDAGSNLFNGVELGGGDGAFAVHGITEGVHHAAEETFSDGNGEEFAGRLNLVALLELGDVAEDDATDLVFAEVEGDADDAVGEGDHLVIHHLGEAIHLGDAVGDGRDDAGVFAHGFGRELGDLGFDLGEDGAHFWKVV